MCSWWASVDATHNVLRIFKYNLVCFLWYYTNNCIFLDAVFARLCVGPPTTVSSTVDENIIRKSGDRTILILGRARGVHISPIRLFFGFKFNFSCVLEVQPPKLSSTMGDDIDEIKTNLILSVLFCRSEDFIDLDSIIL